MDIGTQDSFQRNIQETMERSQIPGSCKQEAQSNSKTQAKGKTMNFVDPWQWWREKLAGAAVEMNPDNPHAGFYRMPEKAFYGSRKTYTPVAYWPGENGSLNCRIGDEDIGPEKGQGLWARVGNNPVSETAYRDVAERGLPWPDEHELVPMGPGHNLPPEDESFEGLRDAIEPLAKEALQRIEGPPIASQDEADQIANLA